MQIRGGIGCAAMDAEGLPLALLVNPHSAHGRTLKLLPRLERALDARRMAFRVERTRGLEDGVERALRAAEAGEVPVVLSGDGLIGAVGGALAGSETPLGVVPGGRGNDLARVLGIPDDPEEAAAILAAGQTRRIDVGEANGKRFLGIVSVGFDSEASRCANETTWLRGNLVYAYAGVRTLIGWKPARFTLRLGEESRRLSGYSVSVANSRAFGGGMFIAPDAELDDGEFDVVTIGEVGKLRFLANLPKVFKGTHVEEDEVRVFRAPRLELSASRPFPVYADGEHLTELPVSLRVLPRALSVIVPPQASE
jgi:YegS/Rv2252/BmrU family lipid kinase